MEQRRRIVIPIVATFVLLLGGSVVRRLAHGAPMPGGKTDSIVVDGRTRNYFVHVPQSYDKRTPTPVVLVLHGGGQSAIMAERMAGMSEKADKENFLVVYPSGTSRFGTNPTWNSGACCAYAMSHNVDDVAFLRALIEKLEHDYTIDAKRVYVTGISNGGMMAYRAACEIADKIAAIAPVEGAQDIACKPSEPVSVIVFHGTADHLVPFKGGSTPFQIGSSRKDTPVLDTMAFWVKQDVCATTPKHEESKVVHVDTYSGCKNGTGVALYAIQGGHHAWPGTTISRNDVAASDLMWTFFDAHPKP